MTMTKFQHLMCVGSYDPLPSKLGPPIKTKKVKKPVVTTKDGFTRVDGKVVSYDPFQDPRHSWGTGLSGRIKHMPPNYLYAIPVNPSKNAPPISEVLGNKDNSEQGIAKPVLKFNADGDVLYIHRTKNRSNEGGKVVIDLEASFDKAAVRFINNSIYGVIQSGEIAQHSVVVLDAGDKLPFPVEQPKVEELDLKSCLAKCRVIASAVVADMQSVGWTGSYSEWQLNQNLLDDLKTEIDSYLSPKTAQAPDNRSEETGIISALVHATRNGAVWDRQAIMKELIDYKFSYEHNPILAGRLVSTYPLQLIEGNYWHDYFWGVCDGKGENNLGKIQETRREELIDRLD